MNEKFFWVGEEVNIPFSMTTVSPYRIKDERTTFPRLPPWKAASTNRSLRLPLQTRLGDVSKGPSRQTHPLINNITFHFQIPPRRHRQIYSNRTPYGTLSPINQITPLCRRCCSRHHLHVSSRLSCPPPLQQCGRQHGRGAGTKRRGEGDSVARTHRAERPFKLLQHRAGVLLTAISYFERKMRTKKQFNQDNRQDPWSVWAQATSMAALPTITLDRWERNRHLPRRALQN